jgi:hypothetical protein
MKESESYNTNMTAESPLLHVFPLLPILHWWATPEKQNDAWGIFQGH